MTKNFGEGMKILVLNKKVIANQIQK